MTTVLEKQIQLLEQEIRKVNGKLSASIEEVVSCRTELTSVKGKVSVCEEELSSCKSELSYVKRRLSVCEEDLSACKSKLSFYEARMATCEQQMDQQLMENRRSATELKKSLDKTKSEASRQKEELKKKTASLTKLQQLFNIFILGSQMEHTDQSQATQSNEAQRRPEPRDQLATAAGVQKNGAHSAPDVQTLGDLFSVALTHSGPFPSNAWTRLDTIEWIHEPSSPFNRRSLCFKASRDGLYALNVELIQQGEGQLKIFLCSTHFWAKTPIGTTESHHSTASKLVVWFLDRGDECWAEVIPLLGNPRLLYCTFSGFLLSE